ncbi:hypothetical protein SDC9_13391 [bioreactor metagenome]|uniref:Uncharacterized protein n=1 Tax=bioreactor metagenome TaxID=1076179 RepID=A0A644TL80_9ZZZZ
MKNSGKMFIRGNLSRRGFSKSSGFLKVAPFYYIHSRDNRTERATNKIGTRFRPLEEHLTSTAVSALHFHSLAEAAPGLLSYGALCRACAPRTLSGIV